MSLAMCGSIVGNDWEFRVGFVAESRGRRFRCSQTEGLYRDTLATDSNS